MTPNNKIKVSIVFFATSIVLIVCFVILPVFSNIESGSREMAKQEGNLVVLETKISNLEEFQATYKGLEEALANIEDLFINSDVPIEFINFLENAASNSSLKIEISSAAKQTVKGDTWPSISFQGQVIGSFPDFLKFLNRVENSSYLVEVKSLSIASIGEGKVKANFSFKAFAD